MSAEQSTAGAEAEVNKEIVEVDARIDWRRDAGWTTLESILGIYSENGPVGLSDALQQHATLACVDVISRDISKVDCDLYERLPDGGKRKVLPNEHWFAGMLALDPNEEHTWREFWQMATIHLVMMNNVFVAKRMSIRGDVLELIPVVPGRVQIQHNPENYAKYYHVSRGNLFEQAMLRGMGDYFTTEQMIHVRKRIVDGLHGLPTLAAGASTIRLSKAISDYQKRLYDNDGQGRVAVQTDTMMKPLSDPSFQRLKSEIRQAVRKMWSEGDALLLEPGYTAKLLSATAADMKVAEMHDAQINATARVFGVPPHKIGHVADEKYSNLEVLERTYAHDVLIPIARAFEDTLARHLLTPKERMRFFIQFNRRQMEIIDFKQRAETLKIGLQHGAVTPDEFREEFGMNPLPNGVGKIRQIQSTMTVLAEGENEVILSAGAPSNSDGSDVNENETNDDGEGAPEEGTKGLRLVK